MSRKYYQKLKKIYQEDFTLMSKMYLLYELDCFTDASKIDDSVVDVIHRGYLDNKNYNSVYDFVLAIQEWCGVHEVDFLDIKDYKAMLEDLF